jgi:phosphoglycolate phosphatase
MSARVVVFDFDGTIADSFAEVHDVYRELAARLGLPLPTDAEIDALRRMGPTDALRASSIPLWRLPAIVAAVRHGLRDRMHALRPFPGIHDAIRALHAAGCRCCVLSSNSRENVGAFLSRHEMRELGIVSCGASLLGKGSRIRRLVRGMACADADVFYVGDEVRDVLAASEAGVRSVAVSWGFNHRSALEAAGPDFVVDAPEQLVGLAAPQRARLVATRLRARVG